MEAVAEIHYLKEDMELSAEAKYQDKLKELDELMKAMNAYFDDVLKNVDVKKIKETTKDELEW